MKQLLAACLIVFAISCQKGEFAKGVPACMKQKIRKLERGNSHQDVPILRYKIKGDYFYHIPADTNGTAMSLYIYNQNCEEVCSAGGYITNWPCTMYTSDEVDTIYIIQ